MTEMTKLTEIGATGRESSVLVTALTALTLALR